MEMLLRPFYTSPNKRSVLFYHLSTILYYIFLDPKFLNFKTFEYFFWFAKTHATRIRSDFLNYNRLYFYIISEYIHIHRYDLNKENNWILSFLPSNFQVDHFLIWPRFTILVSLNFFICFFFRCSMNPSVFRLQTYIQFKNKKITDFDWKYKISRFLVNFDMLSFLTSTCNRPDLFTIF